MNTLEQLVISFINENYVDTKLFETFLRTSNDPQKLKQLIKMTVDASEKHSQITIPMLRRILEINSLDIEVLIVLGWFLWIQGEDDECMSLLKKAKEIDSGNILVMTFETALSQDTTEQAYIFEQILIKDPNNRIAKENLQKLKQVSESSPTIILDYDEFPSEIKW